MFVDAFRIFRNMYRSLHGVYLIYKFFPKEICEQRSSVLPVTLGLYGSDLADMFDSMFHMSTLDSREFLTVNGEQVFVCGFVSVILGDMVGQQKLAGCLRHQANFPC